MKRIVSVSAKIRTGHLSYTKQKISRLSQLRIYKANYIFQINYKSGVDSYSVDINVPPTSSPNHEQNYLQLDTDQGLWPGVPMYMVRDWMDCKAFIFLKSFQKPETTETYSHSYSSLHGLVFLGISHSVLAPENMNLRNNWYDSMHEGSAHRKALPI
jgi:hypothetical protein